MRPFPGDAGLSQTQIRREVFGNHKKTEEIAGVIVLLSRAGLIRGEEQDTGGRKRVTWKPVQRKRGTPDAQGAQLPPQREYQTNIHI